MGAAMSMSRFAFLLCGAACLAVQAAPVIYPAKGQSVSQTDHDKLACFEWSKSQSGFDPMQALATPAPAATPSPANNGSNGSNGSDPTGSMVRGAAGGAAVAELTHGDAGKGAAVGVLGAAMRDHMKQQQQQQAKQQQAAQQQRAQQQAASTQQRATFDRAFGACMEGRGYVVK